MDYKKAWENMKSELEKMAHKETNEGNTIDVVFAQAVGKYGLGLMDRVESEQFTEKAVNFFVKEKIEKPVFLIALDQTEAPDKLKGVYGLKIVSNNNYDSITRDIAYVFGIEQSEVYLLILSVKKINTVQNTALYREIEKLSYDKYMYYLSRFSDVATDVDF